MKIIFNRANAFKMQRELFFRYNSVNMKFIYIFGKEFCYIIIYRNKKQQYV